MSADQRPNAVIDDGAGNWVVAWEGFLPQEGGSIPRGVFVTRVANDGTVLDPEGRARLQPPQPVHGELRPRARGRPLPPHLHDLRPALHRAGRAARLELQQPAQRPRAVRGRRPLPARRVERADVVRHVVRRRERQRPARQRHARFARRRPAGRAELHQHQPAHRHRAGRAAGRRGTARTGSSPTRRATTLRRRPTSRARTSTSRASRTRAPCSTRTRSSSPTTADIETAPSITPGVGGGALVVWHASLARDVHAARVSAAGALTNSTAVGLGAPRQSKQRMASSGSGFLTVFRSDRVEPAARLRAAARPERRARRRGALPPLRPDGR